ncbi:MAG TPA: FAD-dependent oxidoreductase [Actinomycetota bacterium]|nr:FAD-dependent oxidoreductase [Actinomycetota bacterium]
MTDTADAVVVGGGVIGLTVARELARAGVDRVVVLEREPAVGQGSSSRANGGVRAQFSTRINVEFSRFSIADLERLHREHEGLPAFHQTGYLLVTGDSHVASQLRESMALQRALGVDTRWMEPPEVLEAAPFLRPDGLIGGTFHERDGFLDPYGVVQAVLAEARALGVRVRTGEPVDTMEISRGNDFLIRLGNGDELRARWVVNAAGADARVVASMLGAEIPVEPVRRNLAYVAEQKPGPLIPMCVDLDTGVLIRREVSGGFVVAYSDPTDPPSRETTVDPMFVETLADRVGNRFPFLETMPIDRRNCWAGLYPETPDHHAIVGETPELPRFIQCVGFGGHGIMHSPAAGKAVAELVTTGSCTTFDLHALRPSRFAEKEFVVETAVF